MGWEEAMQQRIKINMERNLRLQGKKGTIFKKVKMIPVHDTHT